MADKSMSNPYSDNAAGLYNYSPLSQHGSIRLIRLMAHRNKDAPVQCQLFEYPLQEPGPGGHLYEALSYVWGSTAGKQPIYIQQPRGNDGDLNSPDKTKTSCLHITPNLHSALSHLRSRFFDRVLWVDAICINQEDNNEKEQQVQSMAQIYASANRVIVWLGEASIDTDGAFQALCRSANKEQVNLSTPQPILALLKRPWFRRIWVLQEVAAARQILMKCGPEEVDGFVFCSGLDESKLPYDTCSDLRALIPPISYLIRHAAFWPQSAPGHTDVRRSLFIRPLGQLADMYHTREATNPLDKVYALLGMGTYGPTTEISVDYEASWEVVFEKLIKLSLSDKVSVGIWGAERSMAVIRGKGRVLGTVFSVRVDDTRGDIQHICVRWNNPSGSVEMPLQASAKPVQEGDALCLVDGAVEPTVIRPSFDGYSAIIIIQAPRAGEDSEQWSERQRRSAEFSTDLVLVWDWEARQHERDRDYEFFLASQGALAGRLQPPLRGYLEKAVRLWNVGVLLNAMRKYKDSGKTLRKAIETYGMARRSPGTESDHMAEVVVDEEALRTMDYVDRFSDAKERVKHLGDHAPLRWAVCQGHEAMARLLLERGADIEARDGSSGWTPFHWAVRKGDEAMVKLLLERGADIEAGDKSMGWTPLHRAVDYGDEAMVKLLLERGADIEAGDGSSGWTPLYWAVGKGDEAMVKLLLERGADTEARDGSSGWTPLHWAVIKGDEAIVKLLRV